jgi:23S rRNA (cytidine1920-2'-O)/16S rRNA (cytidine1409-2'-O)-methyltransferase
MTPDPPCPYVSRGGLKLAAALDAFGVDPSGWTCADLGCNVGGFTDCLLQRGAAHVYAVDTGYGALAWKLRQDPRVTVLERTNALHFDPAAIAGFGGCDLVTIDLAWTRQCRAIPAALRWLRQGGFIITLIKPHYEADRAQFPRASRGVLDEETARQVAQGVLGTLHALGARVVSHIVSPIRGGAGKGHQGNVEYLAALTPFVVTS